MRNPTHAIATAIECSEVSKLTILTNSDLLAVVLF